MDPKFVKETLAKLADNPQRVSAAQHAFDTIARGIAELAKLGVNVGVAAGATGATPGTEYPKMLVSDKIAPYELQVNSPKEEMEASAKGWKSLLPKKASAPIVPAAKAAPAPAAAAKAAETGEGDSADTGTDDVTG